MEETPVIVRKKNVPSRSAIGTSLTGYIDLTYNELVSIFGKPNSKGDQYKVDWEWIIMLNDTIITIYNYKSGPSYGNKGIKAKDIDDWHIGSKHSYDLRILEDYIKQETGDRYRDSKFLIRKA
jgi:hypothetical protein